uniref:AlNc14C173G8048 protein n=1 Tax=Albugo laibachii Nc14 TaxID=890382 RepID=F0WNM7_9STRA|nr:AlNc14C173G8048 [Albugo laibachii Nc14]|eukprot:CCA22918.1 AlNc14C173G8048 [Albugo laibachii Nc14]
MVRISIGGIATIAFTLLDSARKHSAFGMKSDPDGHDQAVVMKPSLKQEPESFKLGRTTDRKKLHKLLPENHWSL